VKKFDPAKLFARRRTSNQFPPIAPELDAVASGRRAMCPNGFLLANFYDDPRFVQLVEQALDRNLVVVLGSDSPDESPHPELHTFTLRPEELWRIAALRALRATAYTDGRWTNASMMQERSLYGDSTADRKKLLAEIRYQRSSWGSCDVYALLTKKQRAAVARIGNRCFGEPELAEQLTFFIPCADLRPDAYQLVPEGLTLARAGFGWRAVSSTFGHPREWPRRGRSAQLTRKQIATMTSAYVSNVQFLGARGWR
jgi:hypothetical protein